MHVFALDLSLLAYSHTINPQAFPSSRVAMLLLCLYGLSPPLLLDPSPFCLSHTTQELQS